MSTRIFVDLPDHVYRQVESIARRSRRAVTEVVAEAVSRSILSLPIDPRREGMLREIEAYRAMHAELLPTYRGQYVAIQDGKLVDHDPDPVALLGRINRDFPGQTVLRRKVEETADVALHFRSPRISTQP